MPIEDPNKRREYQRRWIQQRRSEWINDNGPCAYCGSSVNLEVDHIDPLTKSLNPSHIWSRAEHIRQKELAKCQVLCGDCHGKKTSAWYEHREVHNASMYAKGCRCNPCTIDHAVKMREYRNNSGV